MWVRPKLRDVGVAVRRIFPNSSICWCYLQVCSQLSCKYSLLNLIITPKIQIKLGRDKSPENLLESLNGAVKFWLLFTWKKLCWPCREAVVLINCIEFQVSSDGFTLSFFLYLFYLQNSPRGRWAYNRKLSPVLLRLTHLLTIPLKRLDTHSLKLNDKRKPNERSIQKKRQLSRTTYNSIGMATL